MATKKSSKWLHAGLLALVGVGTDIGAQLSAGTLDVQRSVVVGLVIGGLSRVLGAIVSARVSESEDEGNSDA